MSKQKTKEEIISLMELASDHIDYWTGTMVADIMELQLTEERWDDLEESIKDSAKLMFYQDYQNDYELYQRSE